MGRLLLNDNSSIKIARLITIEKKIREAQSKTELEFLIVNELKYILNNYYLIIYLKRHFHSINRFYLFESPKNLSLMRENIPFTSFSILNNVDALFNDIS